MWIMGCVDENDQLIKVEPSSFKDLNKLSPLIICNSTAKSTSVASATSALFEETNSTSARKTTTVISSTRPVSIFNHHQVRIAGALQSTRWSPTAEQLMALEELYRNGTKTPTAQQIQEITAKLRRFGKIEGKNVFYWFQNHKARDKKKQRLKMELAASRSNLNATRHLHNHHYSKTLQRHNNQSPEILGTEGARGTSLEVENTKREPYSNCRAVSEESASAPRAATTTVTERRTNTTQVKKEIKQYYNYSSWKPMEMPFFYPIVNLISTTKQPTVIPMASLDHKLMLEREPLMPIYNNSSGMSFFSNHEIKQSSTIQTLELFPLQSDDLKNDVNNDQLAHKDTKNVAFGAGNYGLIKSDLSLSLLVSLEN